MQDIGQIPITEEDIKNIDDIINNYDGIVVDEKGGIVYSKRMQDGTVIYVEEVRRGRKELAFKSMRKMKGNIPNDLMEKMFSPENLNVLNESAILSFDDILSQLPEKSSGNQEKMRFSIAPIHSGFETFNKARLENKDIKWYMSYDTSLDSTITTGSVTSRGKLPDRFDNTIIDESPDVKSENEKNQEKIRKSISPVWTGLSCDAHAHFVVEPAKGNGSFLSMTKKAVYTA